MNVDVKWDKVTPSRWATGHIDAEAARLQRHLPESSHLHMRVARQGPRYQTKVHVHALGRDWIAAADGENLWEGISAAFSKILRKLDEFKSVHKNKIHRRMKEQINYLY